MKQTCVYYTALAVAISSFSCLHSGAESAPASTVSTNATPQGAGAPRIVLETNSFDFGTVKQGEVVKHGFIFTNTGTANLEIKDVKPGCGCTTAGTWDKVVEPGKTGSIPLQFNSASFGGKITKSATVTCNDPEKSTLMLQITGTVWKPIDVTPSMAMFNFGADDETNQIKTLRIVSNLDEPLQLSDVKCNNAAFTVELKTVREGKEFLLEITASPPTNALTVFGNITVKTSSTNAPSINATAYSTVQPALAVFPQQVMIPAAPLTNTFTSQITVRNNTTNVVKLSDPALDIPGAEVKIQEVQPGRQFTLALTVPSGVQLKPGEHREIVIKSDNPKNPLVKIPVMQAQPPPAITAAAHPSSPVSSSSRVVPTRAGAPTSTEK